MRPVDAPDAHEFHVHSASELEKPYLHETANHFASWHLAGYSAQLPFAVGCCRMFGIFGKRGVTTNELAQQLASAFAKSALSAFDEPDTTQTSVLWAAHRGGAQSREATVREWLVFNLASYMEGCISSMGTNDVNQSLLRHFITCIAEEASALGVFDTADDFMQLGRERTQQYQSAVVSGNPGLSLQKIAHLFLETTGRSANDPALLAAAAGAFTGSVVASKAMFDTLQKEFRIDAV